MSSSENRKKPRISLCVQLCKEKKIFTLVSIFYETIIFFKNKLFPIYPNYSIDRNKSIKIPTYNSLYLSSETIPLIPF